MPTIDQYSIARIRNGSVEFCLMTLNIAGGYELPADEMASDGARAVTEMACLVIGLDNDIISYHKERERADDRLNIIDVIAFERQASVEEAVAAAASFRDEILMAYLDLARVVSSGSSAMARYVGGLNGWIRGNLDWSLNTVRYPNPSNRKTTIISVEPGRQAFAPPPGIAWWWTLLPGKTGSSVGGSRSR
jgi:hypothetical protein